MARVWVAVVNVHSHRRELPHYCETECAVDVGVALRMACWRTLCRMQHEHRAICATVAAAAALKPDPHFCYLGVSEGTTPDFTQACLHLPVDSGCDTILGLSEVEVPVFSDANSALEFLLATNVFEHHSPTIHLFRMNINMSQPTHVSVV